MWVVSTVLFAICVPSVRTFLENLFAELTVIFVNWMGLLSVITLAVPLCLWMINHSLTTIVSSEFSSTTPSSRFMQQSHSVKAMMGQIYCLIAVLSTMLPITVNALPVLPVSQSLLTKCNYSDESMCINNPGSNPVALSIFPPFTRGPNRCTILGAAFTDISSLSALPGSYNPISTQEAYANNSKNKFSEWSDTNQKTFKINCPLLYQNEIVKKKTDLLCCTESQYLGLQNQVRMITGSCQESKTILQNVWCQYTCNPSNSMFLDVNQIHYYPGAGEYSDTYFPAIEEATFYVGDDWARDVYEYSKKDTIPLLLCNSQNNCTSGQQLLQNMGKYAYKGLGAPNQINFVLASTLKKFNSPICDCNPAKNQSNCIKPMDQLLPSCLNKCGTVCAADPKLTSTYTESCIGGVNLLSNGSVGSVDSNMYSELWASLKENVREHDFKAMNIVLIVVGICLALLILLVAFIISRKRNDINTSNTTTAGTTAGTTAYYCEMSFVDMYLSKLFGKWGAFVSRKNNPYIVLITMLIVICVCAAGMHRLEAEIDPVKLWVSESSTAFKERERYAQIFMPFYRTEQVLMTTKDEGSIDRTEYLREAIRIQTELANLRDDSNSVGLTNICWKATGTECTVNSITQYFQNKLEHFEVYAKHKLDEEHLKNCLSSPTFADINVCNQLKVLEKNIPNEMSDCPCLSAFGAPMNNYNTYLGGFPPESLTKVELFAKSNTFVSTILAYNYYEKSNNDPAIAWERAFIKYLQKESARNTFFDIAFMAEISISDEIARESTGDILPALLSYILMIIYVTIGINRWSFLKNKKEFFISAKFLVGFCGIITILLSVLVTMGLFSWFYIKVQVVIMEVVPFLTLAIGVDNIFLIVNEMNHVSSEVLAETNRNNAKNSAADRANTSNEIVSTIMTKSLQNIGPSICMASISESLAFAFGCISPMPAVLWFAAFSSVAVLLNFIIQMSFFVAIVTLDKRRELNRRYDVVFCIQAVSSTDNNNEVDDRCHSNNILDSDTNSDPMSQEDDNMEKYYAEPMPTSGMTTTTNVVITPIAINNGKATFPEKCISVYADILSNPIVKVVVLLAFTAWTIVSIHSTETLQQGLPQQESMPSESYMVTYFNAIDQYLATGPPIFYIVETGYKSNPSNFQLANNNGASLFCKSKEFCDPYAIPKIVEALGNNGHSNLSHISPGTFYSWIDDFWPFISPQTDCCRIDNNKKYLQINMTNVSYSNSRKAADSCLPPEMQVPPVPEKEFMSLFRMFATASAGSMCAHGGGSIYRGQFSVDGKSIPVVGKNDPQMTLNSASAGNAISAFSYMAISNANPTQQDYINSYKQSKKAAKYMSEKTGLSIWSYSIFFVFFDQYLTIVNDTFTLVGSALAGILVIHIICFQSILVPVFITLVIACVVVNVVGLMPSLGIMLNGLSVVNLIIAAGISVEFCSHFARYFMKIKGGDGNTRMKLALKKVMVSVIFGITITKIVGLSALTLADSRIFQKYYFRMYMSIVLCGLLHGMVLLPVLLSIVGDWSYYVKTKSEVTDTTATTAGAGTGGDNVETNFTETVTPKQTNVNISTRA